MSAWPWIGGAIALAIYSPYLVWQGRNDWPMLQHFRSVIAQQAATHTTAGFLLGQLVEMHPATILVWGSGLVFLLLPGEGRRFRPFALVYLSVLLLRTAFPSSRPSDMASAYPPLLAAGGVALERWIGALRQTGASARRGPSGGSTRIESPARTSPPVTTMPMTAALSTTRPDSSRPFVASSSPGWSPSI